MTKAIIAFAALALTAGYLGEFDFEQTGHDEAIYCKMVAQWKADSDKPENERAGWPAYRTDITCPGAK